MIWTKDIPKLQKEWYWWRLVDQPESLRPIFFDDFYLKLLEGRDGEWSNCPIPFPDEKEKVSR